MFTVFISTTADSTAAEQHPLRLMLRIGVKSRLTATGASTTHVELTLEVVSLVTPVSLRRNAFVLWTAVASSVHCTIIMLKGQDLYMDCADS